VGIAAQIVEPHDVVGVRMREDDRVEPADIFAQGLGAKVGAGVDHPGAFRRFDIDGRAQTLIARIGRMTDLTIAADHGHALRSSRAEEGQDKLRVES
jgi:hypothetical protein